ncbi:MAG: hypothetical protein CMO01_19955 [Thalassobius sp.]|nr:hypothetical protein [Thalassovita sp.]
MKKSIYHKNLKILPAVTLLTMLFILQLNAVSYAQVTEYIQNFDSVDVPTEWVSTSGTYIHSIVEDVDPYTADTVSALQMAINKNSQYSGFTVYFPDDIDISENRFVTIRLRNPEGVHSFEIRFYDTSGASSVISSMVLSEGYNELYFQIGTTINLEALDRMIIRPTTGAEFTTYQGNIYFDYFKIGNNDDLPPESADLLNLYVRDNFNVTSFDIDNTARTVQLEYAGETDATSVRLYTANSGASYWSTNTITSYRNYDAGFTADLTSLLGTITNTYTFSATRIDANLRALISPVTNSLDNANLSNLELDSLGNNILAYVANEVGGTFSGSSITTAEGVTITVSASAHANIGTSGAVTYPTGDPVNGSITLTVTENGYSEDITVFLNILPELLPGVYIPPIYKGIDQREIVLPVEVLLGDSTLFSDSLSFDFVVNDTAIIGNFVESYVSGDKTLLLGFDAKEVGPAILDISISNSDSTIKTVKIGIAVESPVTADNKGARYAGKDVRHWQPRPYKTNATNMSGYPVTVSESYKAWRISTSSGDAETNANYFFQGILSGILLPPVSGSYQFSITGDSEGLQALWLTQGLDNSTFPDETDPLNDPQHHLAKLGENGTITLEAGVPYYFEGHHRQIVNDWIVDVKWKRPGDIDFTNISDNYIVWFVDFELPEVVTGISSVVGETGALIRWGASTDDQGLKGYHVYLNGEKITDEALVDTELFINGLTGETDYEIVVASEDNFGHVSFPSAIHRITTTANTTTEASLPTTFAPTLVTAFKADFSWSTSPEALAYNIYLDGEKLNENIITDTTYQITGLTPEQAYTVELRTINVSLVESTSAFSYNLNTLAFDINNPDEDILTAEVDVTLNPIAKATGMAVNVSENSTGMPSAENAQFMSLMDDFKPAGLRFGAIPANSISYSSITGSSSSYFTIGDFVHYSIESGGSYAMICTGPGESTDYFNNPTSTYTKLMEYLGGNSSTTEGARRAGEGYTDPFIDQIDVIVIELGNEVWGGDAHGVPNLAGTDFRDVYLQWVTDVKNAIVASPYYDPEKILISVNARSPQFPDFQDQIFEELSDDEFPYILSLSGYVGGNLMDSGEDFSDLVANSRLAYHKQSYDRMAYYIANLDKINRKAIEVSGRIWPYFPYESNSTQSNYHGTLGQALLTVDYLHEYVKKGAILPALFAFEGGQWRMVTQEANGTYTKRPLFHLSALSNETTRDGVMLESTTASAQKLTNHYEQEFEFAPVGFHAFNRGGEYVLQLYSREYEEDYVVKVNLPDVGTISNTKMTIVSGESYESSEVTFTETTDITVEDGMLVTVPKYSMVVITFDADDLNLEAPLANVDFTQVTSVNIATSDSSLIIDDSKAYLGILTSVEPEDAYVTTADVIVLDPDSTGAEMKGSLLYPGTQNGVIQVFARSKSDSTIVSDTLTITIDKSSFEPVPVKALKVSTQPNLTGILDSTWSLAKPNPLTNVVVGQVTPENLSANFRALWDENYLYIHFEITDDFLRTDANAAAPWEWDGVEVFVDALNLKNTSYTAGNDAQYASAYQHNFDQLWKTSSASKEGIIVKDTATAAGYNKVLAFPLTTINVPVDSLPHIMGFDAQVNDSDAGSGRENKITWNALVDDAWTNPSSFGELVLDEYRELQGIALTDNDSVTLNADEQYRVYITYTPTNATFTNLSWVSSDTSVATVSTSGNVTAIDEGTAMIVVTSEEGGFMDTLYVEVTKPVTGILLTPSEDAILPVGQTLQLNASVVPADAYLQGINWTSSDEMIATVDSTGLVTALAEGDVEITATTEHRGFSQTVNILVNIPVTSVSFQLSSLNMAVSGTINLLPFVSIQPSNATIQDLTWSSSDSTVAAIDTAGVLSGIADGEVIITVTTVDGAYTDQLIVIVGEGATVDTGEIDGKVNREFWTDITGYQVSALTSTEDYPNDPTGSDYLTSLEAVDWDNPTDNQTWYNFYGQRIRGYIHPDTTGTYYFFLSSDDQSELYLSTDDDPENKVLIANISTYSTFNQWDKLASQKSAAITLEKDHKYYVEILHKEASGNDHLRVGWLKPGETGTAPSEIVPSSVLSSFFDTDAISNVTIALNMDIGETLQLDAVIKPYDFPDQNVTWSSSDTSVVAIDSYGEITANGSGMATIKVTTEVGGLTDQLEVIVTVSNERFAGDLNGKQRPSDFEIYPNPVNQEVFVNIPKLDGTINMSLIDIRGIVVEQREVSNELEQVTFDVSKLANGLYVLRINTEKYSTVQKLQVNH